MSHSHARGHDRPQLIPKVPQELVHKHASDEVLLTDWTTHGDDRHTVRAHWPRFHSFYWPRNRRFDPLLFVETVRQTFPLLSHVAYGVPHGSHLVWDDFAFEIEPSAMQVPQAPADVVLEITCTDVRTRRGCLVSMSMHADVRVNGQYVGNAGTRFTNHSPAVYRRLRGTHDLAGLRDRVLPLPPALPPATVGHCLPENVVLAATERADRWQLRADLDHGILFDHPVDHAPGMLLLEALRQAAHANRPDAHSMVTAMSVSFTGWVELDAPTWVTVEPLSPDVLKAVIAQDHGVCLTGEVTIKSVPPPTAETGLPCLDPSCLLDTPHAPARAHRESAGLVSRPPTAGCPVG
ncbi:ScbA/BarX family gamma-butyrolactone biosynthesis protein [Streptomyces sp. NPDC013455]|uniref:ScbA/BarX family gamma-butyrolactone biosynthesis protein n=1 Tax=Streptomyces sp. NPDC013455 TaxID=3155605 RepID=UPI0033F30FC1